MSPLAYCGKRRRPSSVTRRAMRGCPGQNQDGPRSTRPLGPAVTAMRPPKRDRASKSSNDSRALCSRVATPAQQGHRLRWRHRSSCPLSRSLALPTTCEDAGGWHALRRTARASGYRGQCPTLTSDSAAFFLSSGPIEAPGSIDQPEYKNGRPYRGCSRQAASGGRARAARRRRG
jgi:hypothetical protein